METPSASARDVVLNPATEEILCTVPRSTSDQVAQVVDRAASAFAAWSQCPPGERANALLRLADAVEKRTEELARLESSNVGKPMGLARDEVAFVIDNLRFFAGAARFLEGRATAEYMRGYTSSSRREPLGVVAAITPWNFPMMMAAWKVGAALAAGNCLVLKPSELTPLTTLRLVELAAQVVGPDILSAVTGDGPSVGRALVRHPRCRLVSLTGSVATGIDIMRQAASGLKRTHLELGGKAPVLVFKDADLGAAIDSLCIAGYYNSGQDCTAACRVLAQSEVAEEVGQRLADAARRLVVGDPASSDGVEMGPVISAQHRDRVLGFVERAIESNGRLLCGGHAIDGPGFFVAPTVITGVAQHSEIVQNEVFGPVVTVQEFTDEQNAVLLANDVRYGLAASIFTRDAGRVARLTRSLEFGTVWVNDHLPIVAEMPFGGYKSSGFGRDMSIYAVDEYTQLKHVMTKLGA